MRRRRIDSGLVILDIYMLAQECAPAVHPQTIAAIVRTESAGNPFAIGVVGGRLERQPKNHAEARATAEWLLSNGWNASFGLGQVNKINLARYGLTTSSVFNPCANLKAASAIFADNYARAIAKGNDEQSALRLALSEYYSGNYTTGFNHGYVQKVVQNAAGVIRVIPNNRALPTQPSPAAGGAPSKKTQRAPRAENIRNADGLAQSDAFMFSENNIQPEGKGSDTPFMFDRSNRRMRGSRNGID